MAQDQDKEAINTLPQQFMGLWVEEGQGGKELGRISISEESIAWKQCGVDTDIIRAEDTTFTEHDGKLMFSTAVVVNQGKQIPLENLDGKASVVFQIDGDDLVVEISGINERVKRCGAIPQKGCIGITREIVDGEMITCIKHSPRLHRYRKYRQLSK